jgi:hypothetical protein
MEKVSSPSTNPASPDSASRQTITPAVHRFHPGTSGYNTVVSAVFLLILFIPAIYFPRYPLTFDAKYFGSEQLSRAFSNFRFRFLTIRTTRSSANISSLKV